MRTNSLKNKFFFLMISLFSLILVIWIVFYFSIIAYMQNNTKEHLDDTASQIINDLENEFAQMEQLVFSLRQSPTVRDFILEQDIPTFYDKSSSVNELLLNSNSDSSFISSVVLYNKEGSFYRFLTPIGNTSSSRIFALITQMKYPEHLIVNGETENLIGYGATIPNQENTKNIGAVAVLFNEEALMIQLSKYESNKLFHIAVAVNKELIASNQTKDSFTLSQVEKENSFFVKQKIGITPFVIIVATNNTPLNATNLFFTIASSITVFMFCFALLHFSLTIKRQFLSPMMEIMKSVDDLDMDSSPLSLTNMNNTEFSSLVERINEMLERIHSKNQAVQTAQLQKQKAIIISLKKQINSHFTVNILNIIKILITKKDLDEAITMCDGLSTLMRYAHDEDEFINVWDEFYVLENYVSIMNLRYSNKLNVDFNIDDCLMNYRIPRMLLQPIIENAIVHGYKNCKSNCRMDILGLIKNQQIIITIKDYGEGINADTYQSLNNQLSSDGPQPEGIKHVALQNIHHRIKSYYGDSYGISIESLPKYGTTVTVTLGCYTES